MTFGENDARNSCVVVEDAEVVPQACVEELADRVCLPESDFKRKQAAGNERCMGLGDEKAIDAEAVWILFGPAEEREVGFMIADFGSERGLVGGCNVRRVGDDDVEGAFNGGEQV